MPAGLWIALVVLALFLGVCIGAGLVAVLVGGSNDVDEAYSAGVKHGRLMAEDERNARP